MAEKKTLKEIQHDIDKWVQNHGGYWPPLSMLSAIVEEIGELAREINAFEGFKPKKHAEKNKKDLGEELADLIFSVICLANYYEIDLNERIVKSIKKYSKRDSNRFI